MMIEINKDIEHYKESIVLGLTARQLFFSLASVVTGGGLVLLLYPYIGSGIRGSSGSRSDCAWRVLFLSGHELL